MRYFLLALFFLFPLAVSAELLWNDSNVVELPGASQQDTPPVDETPPEEGSTPSENVDESNGSDEDSEAGTEGDSGSVIVTENGEVIVVFDSDDEDNASNDLDSATTDDDLIDVLSGGGAVVFSQDSGSDASQNGGTTPTSNNSSGSSAAPGGGVFISGAKVRETLKGKGIERVTLRGFTARNSASQGGGTLTFRDLGLVAASTALRDRNIEDVFFALRTFDLTYRSRGFLLGFVPIAFPVRIHIEPAQEDSLNRVGVRFPWYRFFVRELISENQLRHDINDLVVRIVRERGETEGPNVQGALFEELTLFLQTRFDAVANGA